MNFVEKTSTYRELRQDYELQCLENSRKQDRIRELSTKIREQEEKINELENIIKILKEVQNGQPTTISKTSSKRTSKQTKKV